VIRALALAAAAILVGGAAQAQFGRSAPRDEGCILDRCADREDRAPASRSAPRPTQRSGGEGGASAPAPGRFDFYVLALSWSASFCELEGAEKGRSQCAPGSKLGFVVHGLWPQYERGFPSNCEAGAQNPSRTAMEAARDVFPEPGLARHQWRKHGSCTGLSAGQYFAEVRRARDRVAVPDSFRAPERAQSLAPQDVQRAFIEANRGLRPGMLGVSCRRGLLQEVRVCLSKDLREFVPCPEVARNACRTREITAPGVL
jgi:ribonuclease T2